MTRADGIGFPRAAQNIRIRRDGYDAVGTMMSKEIVHAITNMTPGRAAPADLAPIACGQRGIESVH